MNLTIADLFPVCNDRHCPQYGKHKHPLEHQLDLINSDEKYVYIQGGYGSAKTLAACVLGVLLSLKIPGNRGVVARQSYPKLHDSTQRVFMEVLERTGSDYIGRENRDGWYHRLIFPNGSEVFFRETKNLGRFLGPEYGWWFVDEALEETRETFKKLQGRLRLPAAGLYLRGILASNPPHHTHWLHSVFGEESKSWKAEVEINGVVEATTFRFIKCSTRANPHNPPGYLSDLLSGLAPHEIARLVEGDYGFTPEGAPAYPQFRHGEHIGEPGLIEWAPNLTRSWDFGFNHPAITFHQQYTCLKKYLHWSVLAEYDGHHIEAGPLADGVLAYTKKLFPTVDPLTITDCGDRSGAAASDKGPGPVYQLATPPWNLTIEFRSCPVEPGLRLVRDFLTLPTCECGEPRFQIHRRCRHTINGLAGGYHLRPDKLGKAQKEDPTKDGFYDDFLDSVRYYGENVIRGELVDPSFQAALARTERPWRRDTAYQQAMRKIMREDRG